MPHYRINIKLEQYPVTEYLIEDDRRELDLVYHDYRRRVFDKNGAGRVTYFDLVMVTEESIKHQADRKEVFHEKNEFGYHPTLPATTKWKKERRTNELKLTLAERNKQ
jgi:hypothetical protein